MIPSVALERGERAFVAVLRRRYPDASFVLRDRAISPDDSSVASEIGAGTTANLDLVEEPAENFTPLSRGEAAPKVDQGTPNGKPRRAR
jgi:hypothetical protein